MREESRKVVPEMGNSNSGAGVNSGVVAFPPELELELERAFRIFTRSWSGVDLVWSGVGVELELAFEICDGVGVELSQLGVELEWSWSYCFFFNSSSTPNDRKI